MRALILPSWFPRYEADFVGSYFQEQACALVREGVEASVLALDFYGWRDSLKFVQLSRLATSEVVDDVYIKRVRRLAIFSPSPKMMARRWRRTALRSIDDVCDSVGRPDVLVAHSLFHAGPAANAISRRLGIPYILVEHSSRFHRGLVRDSQKAEGARVIREAFACFAVSADLAGRATAFYGEKKPWGVIPNSVDERFLSGACARGPSNGFVFFSVGSLIPEKQVDQLILAFASAFSAKDEVALKIVGSGPELLSLQRLVESLGLQDRITFLGPLGRAELVEALRGASALAHASRYETFGVVLIEAMALGLPVVAIASGGPIEIVGKGDGYLVAPNSPPALQHALSEMVRERRSFSAESIRQSCRSRYSQKSVSQALAGVLAAASEAVHATL